MWEIDEGECRVDCAGFAQAITRRNADMKPPFYFYNSIFIGFKCSGKPCASLSLFLTDCARLLEYYLCQLILLVGKKLCLTAGGCR